MASLPEAAAPVPVPYVALGVAKIDSEGRFTARGTASIGGQMQDAEWSGSLKVNPDCTATDTYSAASFQGADRFVILDNGNEMRMMPTNFPAGPAAATYRFRRISSGEPRCTGDMLRGVYAGSGEGALMIPVAGQLVPTPFSALFTMTFQPWGMNPIGRAAIAATASLAGNIADVQFSNASMAVNSDCTATLRWTAQLAGQTAIGTVRYIVLDNGDELMGMEIEDSLGLPVELENHKRISRTP